MNNNVHCQICNDDDLLKVYRGELFIAVVTEGGNRDPVITFVTGNGEQLRLSFNDFAIIQDNWNQMVDMNKGRCVVCKGKVYLPNDECVRCGQPMAQE
jgi:methyl coenzyme M reductase gamma subunit